ncbi:hypothetical protein QYE76_071947 [Lolium multiflorum]|uniref:GRF-type domain-containing protein n=1 Tax=Lolium multiflorum TaxID=4521 RepID=A0AAD8PH62_LOLMU|nr:hypothetical protein QYE76_071947 [Lolium multiflorum]
MSPVSKMIYDSSGGYVGTSKFPCFCGESADLWRSGTDENPGRLFVKCGMDKRCKYWEWEDEICARLPGKVKQPGRVGASGRFRAAGIEEETATSQQIRADMTVIRYSLLTIALACVWIASRV